jgi:tripeptide aminopeptidase
MINQPRLIATFTDLVRIDSPSGGEKQAAEFVATRLRELGLEPRIDALFNVIAFLPGKGRVTPPLLVNAHTDSVMPCLGIKPHVDEARGIITSDGTTVLGADARAGVAAILEAITAIREQDLPHCPLEIAITAQEEHALVGAKGLDFTPFKSKMGVVLDSHGPVGTIIVQAASCNLIEATITGKAAHAGIEPEKGISAIRVAAEAIAAMKLGRIDVETTANIGIIKGGAARNIVAEKCELVGEARSRRESKLNRQTNAMTRALERAAKNHRARVDVKVTGAYTMFRFSKRDSIVQRVCAAIERIGRTPKLDVSGGGSDANVFNARGIACVPIAIGYEKIHTTEEFIPIAELVKTAQLVVELARL